MRVLSAFVAFACFLGLQAQPICDELQAGFTSSISGLSVQFTNASTGAGLQTTYQWTYGDGNTANAPNPSHTYTAAGEYEVCLYVISIYFNGGGVPTTCVDTACTTIVVGSADPCDGFEACFEASQTAANTIAFGNCSQPGANAQYLWTFGDGSNGSGTYPTHVYDQPGTYIVCVTAYGNGCEDTYCWPVVVQGGSDPCDELEAGFTWTTTPNGTQFSNGTTGTGFQTTWYWTFGDGSTSNDGQPFHTYAEPGVYEVCLTAITIYELSGGGVITCLDTACAEVTIGGTDPCDGLSAEFWFGNNGGDPASIFYSASTGAGPNWLWSFGDGTYSDSGAQGTHTYTAAGVYELCLTVWAWDPITQDTCSETSCQLVTIAGGDPCDDFEACFTTTVIDNNSFYFINCTAPGTNVQYEWHFGDGTFGTGVNMDHDYATPGVYEVCLTAYWGNCADSTCTTVTVTGSVDPCDELEAGFTWTTTPNGTQFSNGTSGTGFQTTWYWTLGDGSTSNDAQPFHTYAEPGVYEVCLTAITIYELSGGGVITCLDTACAEVTIGGGDPCDDFEACFTTTVIDNNSFYFINCTVPGTNVQYEWYFGDGTFGTGANMDHDYATPGVYEVCLTAYWGNCADSTCTTVTVTGSVDPCDELEAGFSWTTPPNGTQFSNATTGTGFQTTWYWTFGDGSTSSDAQPFHSYAEPGEYVVCLTAITIYELSGGGVITCLDTACAEVTIGGGDPCDDFEACFTTTVIDNNSFYFINCTAPGTNIQYEWHFGDGSASGDVNAEHSYAEPGTYEVCLTAYWGNCVDSTCTTVTVTGGGTDPCDGLVAGFSWTTTPNGTQFSNGTTGTGFQTTWYWTFGDGSTSNDGQPFHTYAEPGVYEVCLTAISIYESTGGVITCADTTCYEVTIGGGDPCDDFEACFTTTVIDNNSFYFINCTAPGTNVQYLWNFGDGAVGTGANPDHNYAGPGTYEVCLTAYWGNCVDSTCTTIVVEGPGGCEPFQIDFTAIAQGTATIFQATSSVPVVGYIWFFGDGSDQGYGQVITHLYEPPGPYNVCLAAWYWNSATEDTCWAEHCEEIDPFDVGINETAIGSVQLYPNPAHSSFIIDGAPLGADLRVFSTEGRMVLAQRTSGTRTVVDVSALAPATYSVEVRTAEGILWRRFAVE